MSVISGQWSGKSQRSSKSNGAKIIAPNGSILSRNPRETTSVVSVNSKPGSSLKKSTIQGSIISHTKSENLPYRSGKACSVLSGVSSQVARRKKQKESIDNLSQTMKERAMSATSLNRRKSIESVKISSHLKRYSQSDMSIAVKSEIQLMTKEERNKLLQIMDKYKKIQEIEKNRKSVIDKKIKEIQSLRPPYSQFQSNICYICQRTFWPIIFVKYSCSRCKIFICKNCFKEYKNEAVCNSCFEEMIYLSKSDLLLKKRKYNDDSDSDDNIDVDTLKKIINQTEKYESVVTADELAIMDHVDAISKVSSHGTNSLFKKLKHKKGENSTISKKSRSDLQSIANKSNTLSSSDMTVVNSSVVWKPEDTSEPSSDRQGEIMIGLSYNYVEGEFRIIIKKCRNLEIAIPNSNSSNPYVKVELVPPVFSEKIFRTKTINSNLNPEFNEQFKYKNIKYEDVISRNSLITVWHDEKLGKDVFLGQVFLKFCLFSLDDATPIWFKLKEYGPPVINPVLSKYYGDIQFSIKYTIKGQSSMSTSSPSDNLSEMSCTSGSIILWIKQANNLLTSSYSHLPNSYAKCLLLPESSKLPTKKTQIIRKNFNPIWNIQFTFPNIAQNELPDLGMEITVSDKRISILRDGFLGGVSLNIARNGRLVPINEKEVWQQMIAKPEIWIEAKLVMRKDLK